MGSFTNSAVEEDALLAKLLSGEVRVKAAESESYENPRGCQHGG